MPATASVLSLGCRLNLAEGETIRALLAGRDAAVVNTCAVTAEAAKQSRAAIRRVRRERPGAELLVTGCAATIDRAAFAAMPEVDGVIANAAKLLPGSWRSTAPTPVAASTGTARAFVAVQTGCDHSCTFCTIPAGRGASRSEPVEAVIERIAGLGRREVVLTGVDLTSWGYDLPGAPTLGTLVEAILARTTVERLRVSSLDSIEIDDALFELVASEPRVMPHLHLSLQAGDDLTLKRMKRRHLRCDAVRLVERIKARREVAIGADLIAGFPTESEAMFAGTLALLEDCDIVHAHVFPYSERPGTPAARMPQVAVPVRRERAARLRAAAEGRKAAWLAGLVGTVQDVLVEKPGDRGYTPGFAEVRLDPAPGPPSVCAELVEALPFPSPVGLKKDRASTSSARTVVGGIVPLGILSANSTHLLGTPA